MHKTLIKKHFLLLVLVLSFVLAVYRIWEPAVIFTDELFIKDISFSMAQGSSWIIPHIGKIPYLAKPPLLYWMTAPLYFLFYSNINVDPFILRFCMVVSGVGMTWCVYQLSTLWFDKKVALWATLFLITSAPYIYFTKAANWDLPNAFMCTLAIYLYNLGHKKWIYFYLSFFILGISILNRSFLALIPLAVILVEHLIFPQRKLPLGHFLLGILFFLIIILPWHIAAYLQESQAFMRDYIGLVFPYHFGGMVLGDDASSPLFYLSIFFFFLPTLFGIIQLITFLRQKRTPTTIQLTGWVIIPFTILTFSQTRHLWYAIPIIVPLTILAGVFVSKELQKKNSLRKSLVLGASITLLIAGPLALLTQPLPEAPIITIVNAFQKQHPDTTLYQWNYSLIPVTGYYPLVPVRTLYTEKEITTPLFLIIRRKDADKLRIVDKTIVHATDTLYLLHMSP